MQVTSLAALALQNRRALDLLTTEKGGTCLLLNEECCYFVNQSYSYLQDQRTQGSDPSTVVRHILLGPGPLQLGNLAAPSGGTCKHNPPPNLSCSLSFPVLAGSPTRTCLSICQSTPPPALLSPAHFQLPLQRRPLSAGSSQNRVDAPDTIILSKRSECWAGRKGATKDGESSRHKT